MIFIFTILLFTFALLFRRVLFLLLFLVLFYCSDYKIKDWKFRWESKLVLRVKLRISDDNIQWKQSSDNNLWRVRCIGWEYSWKKSFTFEPNRPFKFLLKKRFPRQRGEESAVHIAWNGKRGEWNLNWKNVRRVVTEWKCDYSVITFLRPTFSGKLFKSSLNHISPFFRNYCSFYAVSYAPAFAFYTKGVEQWVNFLFYNFQQRERKFF